MKQFLWLLDYHCGMSFFDTSLYFVNMTVIWVSLCYIVIDERCDWYTMAKLVVDSNASILDIFRLAFGHWIF
jgi:hypothetical protein